MEEVRDRGPAVSDPPEMSELSTVVNVFFEPGRVFEDLKRKPRFIIGSIIIALLVTAYTFGLISKVGEAGIRRAVIEQIEKNPQTASMSQEQKNSAVEMNLTIQKYTRYAIPVFVFISLLLGGLFYFLAAKAFGGTGGFLHGLSVWVYSSIPPTVIAMIANFIVLMFKSADEIDLTASQRGVIHANPGILLDGKSMPVLTTIVSTLDLFMIWGWILAAIGLRITNRLSSGSSWAVVIIVALVGVLFRVIGAFFSGNPA
jgi:hypothetical protein